jgi:hypothetical protein
VQDFLLNDKNFDLSSQEKWDLEGKIAYFTQDTGFFNWAYAITKEGNLAKLFCMDHKEVHTIEGIEGLNKNTNIIYIQQSKEEAFLLVQQGISVSIYEQK